MSHQALERLLESIADGDLPQARKLLSETPALATSAECEALAMAVSVSAVEIVDALLKLGADPRGGDVEPILCQAALAEPGAPAATVLRALVAAGADPNLVEPETGNRPITLATESATQLNPALLQEAGTAWDSFGEIFGAQDPGTAEAPDAASTLADLFKSNIAEAPSEANQGNPGDGPGQRGLVIQTLVELGAEIDAANGEGATALDIAVVEKDSILAEHLLALGAKDRRMDGELILAIHQGSTSEVRALLAAGADPNRQMPRYGLPLTLAAQKGNPDILGLLIQAGARLDAVEKPGDGHTALTLAANEGLVESARALLEAGADPTLPAMDETPLAWAKIGGRATPQLLELLESQSGKKG